MSNKRVYVIDEDTKIPAKLAWTFAGAAVAIAMSFATVLVKVENSSAHGLSVDSQISEMQKSQVEKNDKTFDVISRVDRRLSRIEGRLKIPLPDEEK